VIRARLLGGSHIGGCSITRFVGLDVSQELTAICVVDNSGRRVWRGECATDPKQIARVVRRHAGKDAGLGIKTGPMKPWLVQELRARRLNRKTLPLRSTSPATVKAARPA